MSETRTVYVVGFVTPGSSGGFEWRIREAEAERERERWLAVEGEQVSPVRAVEVPAGLSDDEVTDWLDAQPGLWEPYDHPDYAQGMKVLFADASATVSDGEPAAVEGMVNGAPYRNEAGYIIYVPVWAERDNGREATTIIVAIENMMGEVKG